MLLRASTNLRTIPKKPAFKGVHVAQRDGSGTDELYLVRLPRADALALGRERRGPWPRIGPSGSRSSAAPACQAALPEKGGGFPNAPIWRIAPR